MFNEIHIGPVTVYMYGIMMAIGFFTALRLCLSRGTKMGLVADRIWGVFYCALLGGLVGAKALFLIVAVKYIIEDPSILLDFQNGLVVYGGIIGGILMTLVYMKAKGERFLPYFDLAMPAVSIAQGFGRIGCFCAGCCYGKETDSFFHVVFHHSAFAPNEVPLIPAQLISSAGNFLIGAVLIAYASRKPRDGRVGAMYLILYGIGRFAVEFLRGDAERGSIGPLSTSQAISLVIVAAGLVLFAVAGLLKEPDTVKVEPVEETEQ